MVKRHILGPTPVELVLGPEDYLFGEEKALLEVIEGHDPMPREADNPPYVDGLFITDPAEPNPTVVNNVETLSNVPHIIRRGAAWFRTIGMPDSPGTMIFTVCEDVQRPGVYELPMGTPLRSLIYDYAGGPLPGRQLKRSSQEWLTWWFFRLALILRWVLIRWLRPLGSGLSRIHRV